MKRLLYLATLLMATSLIFAPAALAQGNDISCPEGSAANAAGTRCTDVITGEFVEPISITEVFPETSLTNPCPEGVGLRADGTCNIPAEVAEELVEDPEEPVAENVAEGQQEEAIEEQVEAQQGFNLTPAQDATLEPQTEIENQQPKQKEEMKEIPKTGGIPINSSLVGLGAGALLVGGGLIALKRRNS